MSAKFCDARYLYHLGVRRGPHCNGHRSHRALSLMPPHTRQRPQPCDRRCCSCLRHDRLGGVVQEYFSGCVARFFHPSGRARCNETTTRASRRPPRCLTFRRSRDQFEPAFGVFGRDNRHVDHERRLITTRQTGRNRVDPELGHYGFSPHLPTPATALLNRWASLRCPLNCASDTAVSPWQF
jgi:hypothetical protein